jgi:predicted ATPase
MFLTGIIRRNDDPLPNREFPFGFPWLESLDLEFSAPVTFLIGENGSGKSTLLEAIVALCGLPVSGGSLNEMGLDHGPEQGSLLAKVLSPVFVKRPRDGYFLRAEFQAHFASLLVERRNDPDFWGDPYAAYGGKSLHERSHGEAFLAVMNNRIGQGLFLMDEPESALSPQRQLSLLALIADRVSSGKTQFIIATHSPILMTYPGAVLLSLDDGILKQVTLEETSHYQITRGMLESPGRYWKHLGPKAT